MSITADDQPADFPSQVPARMLNEFSYCPRLFHLEWVQGQFVGNADTAEGTWQHRPPADEEQDRGGGRGTFARRVSRTLLRRNGRNADAGVLSSMQELIAKAQWAQSEGSLLGYEGAVARLYFSQFSKMVRLRYRCPERHSHLNIEIDGHPAML